MSTRPTDTSAEAWAVLEQGIAHMTPGQRVQRALALTVAAHAFALAQIRRRHPEDDERKVRRRLAGRMFDPALMRAAFGADD